MSKYLQIISVLTFTISMLISPNLSAAQTNHGAMNFVTADSCKKAISTPSFSTSTTFFTENKINLLSWNVEKGNNVGWRKELKEFSQSAHIILLQEAIFVDDMKDVTDNASFWSFSPGFKTKKYSSGLMTLSEIQPNLTCSLQKQEPWLRTPKVTSITRFSLQNNANDLLIVNIHQINFTLGIRAFTKQLEEVTNILSSHEGPIIFSGDFNTWRQSRMKALTQITSDLKLYPARFSPDYRKTAFGNHLDHIFTRGFEIKDSLTIESESSDHNALSITLSLVQST